MDILIKEAVPIGMAKKIVVEVKLGRASKASVDQLKSYMAELGEECVAGVLIAESVPRIREEGVHLFRYEFGEVDLKQPQSFNTLLAHIQI
jgi:RecB family endonuclease NucS